MELKIPDSVHESETAILRRALAQVTRKLDDALTRLKQLEGDDVVATGLMPAQLDATDPTAAPHSTIYTPTP